MKNILIVVDMQNDFCAPKGTLSNPECTAAIFAVNELIANGDWDAIVYTMDTHANNYLETQEGKNLPVEHCIAGTWGWELAVDMPDGVPATRVRKDAFGARELADAISELVDGDTDDMTLTFCGVCTDICVISNVMLAKAAFPEAPIVVDASCCAGVTPQSHLIALEAMRACQIKVENDDFGIKGAEITD